MKEEKESGHTLSRILLVDEQEENRQRVSSLLKGVHAHLVTAVSGNDALALCLRYRFALVLLAVHMADMDGYEVATLLHRRKKTDHLPIFLMTNQPLDPELSIKGYRAGVVDVIQLPIHEQIVRAKVQFFLDLDQRAAAQADQAVQWMAQVKRMEQERFAEREAQKAARLATAQQLAEEMDHQAIHRLLADISHEMHDPTRTISALAALALHDEINPPVRDHLTKIARSSDLLTHIVDHLLDYSQLESNQLVLRPVLFHPTDLFDGLASTFSNQAADKGLELLLLLPGDYFHTLFGDVYRLEQILIHLLRRSIQKAKQGSILLKAHPQTRQIGTVDLHFSVEIKEVVSKSKPFDTKMSPPPHDQTESDPLYQGEGLGFALCKKLAAKMGGRIWSETDPSGGRTDHCTVQFQYLSHTEKKRIMPDYLKGLRVLVVDDHALTREVLLEMLQRVQLVATAVESGESALLKLQTAHAEGNPWQLLIIDWRMVGMDGIETVQAMRRQCATLSPPCPMPKSILLTAFAKQTIQQSARRSGIHLCLQKPITSTTLYDGILEVFGKRTGLDQSPAMALLNEELEISRQIGGAKVLLVEDNPINQQVVAQLLKQVGVLVTLASTGQEAVERVGSEPFDAVLMDLQMPVMDGHTASRQIRSNPLFASLPIIAMTAHILDGVERANTAAGMNDHVSKPIDAKRLYETLIRWIHPSNTRKPAEIQTRKERTSPQPSTLPPILEGFDIPNALARLGGEETFYRALLLRFKAHAGIGKAIRTALARGEWETARNLAHLVAGVAGNLSATHLYPAARALEQAIEKAQNQPEPGLLLAFDQALQQVLKSIQTLEQPKEKRFVADWITDENGEDWDREKITPILRELSNLLAIRDTDAELTLETLKQVMQRKNWPEEMKRVEERMAQLDYPEAQKILKKIQEHFI